MTLNRSKKKKETLMIHACLLARVVLVSFVLREYLRLPEDEGRNCTISNDFQSLTHSLSVFGGCRCKKKLLQDPRNCICSQCGESQVQKLLLFPHLV